MRPTTPLHAMLARDFGRPLVCTSGNREGEPLEYEVEAAEQRLAGIADLWLHHDREITRPIDDSVVRIIAGRRVTMRLARGLAPLALDLPTHAAHAGGRRIFEGGRRLVQWNAKPCSARTLATRKRWPPASGFVAHLTGLASRCIASARASWSTTCIPEYFSTQWAAEPELAGAGRATSPCPRRGRHVGTWLARSRGARRRLGRHGPRHGRDDLGRRVSGVHGGVVSSASPGCGRFDLPGGEAAIREPWRIAVAICHQLGEPTRPAKWPGVELRVTAACNRCRSLLERPKLSPLTTSAGRLFDAAAALILGLTHADFDGQAAMRLEAAADRTAEGHYPLPLRDDERARIGLAAAVRAAAGRRIAAAWTPGTLAMRFHRSLARGIVRVCRRRAELPVVLGGGVFQNRLLTELVVEMWDDMPAAARFAGHHSAERRRLGRRANWRSRPRKEHRRHVLSRAGKNRAADAKPRRRSPRRSSSSAACGGQ